MGWGVHPAPAAAEVRKCPLLPPPHPRVGDRRGVGGRASRDPWAWGLALARGVLPLARPSRRG